MKLSPQERADRKAAFRRMGPGEKLAYIIAYYKLPIILGLIAAVAAGSILSRVLTKKEPVLYVGFVNVAAGDDALEALSGGFLDATGRDSRRQEVYVYAGLYLSEDPAPEYHEYSYASRLKVLAAINARQMDVVLMNREAYDIFSGSGYLLDLEAALTEAYPEQYRALAPWLRENRVVLEDNAIEYRLNEAQEYRAVTQDAVNGVDISGFSVPAMAGFSDTVYLGILANSPRVSEAVEYIEYLAGAAE